MIIYKPNYYHDSKCHFCKKNRIEVGSELKVHIEDTNDEEYVICVPRCNKCRNRHKKTTRFSVFGIVSALLVNIMLIGAAASISGIAAVLAAFVGIGLGYLVYYICHSLEEVIVNGGDNEANGKSMIAVDELKVLCGSVFGVNDEHKAAEDDVYYCVNQLSKENLDKLETQYNYLKSEE
ncbi:MAG: hypothetical protein IJ057_13610 [Bacteroidales bacterium]|nr:hypothetical protein [Bacteroidales bacterium]MBQ8959514.1 hypothetical protein [Bacteroidales bacterium]